MTVSRPEEDGAMPDLYLFTVGCGSCEDVALRCMSCGRDLSFSADTLGDLIDSANSHECPAEGRTGPPREFPQTEADRLREAIRWLCTEMPVGWEEIAMAEGRGDVVGLVKGCIWPSPPMPSAVEDLIAALRRLHIESVSIEHETGVVTEGGSGPTDPPYEPSPMRQHRPTGRVTITIVASSP